MGTYRNGHLYLQEMSITRSGAATYFLFSRELATDYACATGLVRSICASAMALQTPIPVDFPLEQLFETAMQTDSQKLLVKVSDHPDSSRVEIFPRD